MPIDFPSSPATGDSYTYGSKQWIWNGSRWTISSVGSGGITGPTGSNITFKGGMCIGLGGLTGGIWFRNPYGIGTRTLQTASPQFFPIWIENTTTLDRLAVRTGGTTGTTGTVVLGIYNTDRWGYPGTLRLEAGSVDFSAANTTYSVTIDHTLERGQYWLTSYIRNGGSGTTWQGYTAYVNTWWNPRVFGDTGSISGSICAVFFVSDLGVTFANNPAIGYYGYNSHAIFARVK